jgi:chromosome segregation ATPase
MTEPTKNVPALAPQDPDAAGDRKNRWRKILEDLEGERDELRVRLHLAKAEAKDELAKLDDRIAELKDRANAAREEAGDALDDIEGAAKVLWGEVRDGLDRVRKSLVD